MRLPYVTILNLLFSFILTFTTPVFSRQIAEIEPNNDYSEAQLVSTEDTIQCYLGKISDSIQDEADWFKIIIDSICCLYQDYNNIEQKSVKYCFFGADSNDSLQQLVFNKRIPLDNDRMIYTCLPGTYYIRFTNNYSSQSEFKLHFLQFKKKQTFLSDEEPNDVPEEAIEIEEDIFYEGNVSFFHPEDLLLDSIDYYTFSSSENFMFETTHDTISTFVRKVPAFDLYKENSTESILHAEILYNPTIHGGLKKGKYFLKITNNVENDYRFKIRLIPDTLDIQKAEFESECLFYNSMDMAIDTANEDSLVYAVGIFSSEPKYNEDRNGYIASSTYFNNSGANAKFGKSAGDKMEEYGICFWAKDFREWEYVLAVGGGTKIPGTLVISTGLDKEIEIYTIGNDGGFDANSTPIDSANVWNSKWTHYAISRDKDGKGLLIVNGRSKFDINIGAIISNDSLLVGSRERSMPCYGHIDELYIINRPFTDDEIYLLAEMYKTDIISKKRRCIVINKKNKMNLMYNLLGRTIPGKRYLSHGVYIKTMPQTNDNKRVLFLK